MTIVDFFKNHGLSGKGLDIRESTKTYEGSEEPILYIQLSKEVEGQDYLVCSKTLASKLRDKSLTLAEANVQLTEEGYGLICPQTTKVFATVDLF